MVITELEMLFLEENPHTAHKSETHASRAITPLGYPASLDNLTFELMAQYQNYWLIIRSIL